MTVSKSFSFRCRSYSFSLSDPARGELKLTSEADTTHVYSVSRRLWLLLTHILQPHIPANEETNSNECETQWNVVLHDPTSGPAYKARCHRAGCKAVRSTCLKIWKLKGDYSRGMGPSALEINVKRKWKEERFLEVDSVRYVSQHSSCRTLLSSLNTNQKIKKLLLMW